MGAKRVFVEASLGDWFSGKCLTHTLWLCGSAGAGKTQLARTLARDLAPEKIECQAYYGGPMYTEAWEAVTRLFVIATKTLL